MGTSTDAILFYGFPIDDGSDNHEVLTGFGENEDDGMDEDELWRKKFNLPEDVDVWQHQKTHPVTIGGHCSCDCRMYYVSIKKSELTANRGCPKKVKTLDIDAKWDEQLNEFCKVYGLKPPKSYGWHLVSDWC